ncbi:secreted Wg-interacting molecule [Lycorma delicatula]|uniref:secreted Wg-interacting molecule n=1 Tax=Lycorma delicatula TaxID=130591 RepID=UPI003F5159E9
MCNNGYQRPQCSNCEVQPLFKTLSTTTLLLLLIGFSAIVNSQHNSHWDLPGPYCGARPLSNQCCRGRQDGCSQPILDTICYCDEFCNRTHAPGYQDCCPDYLPVCLGIRPEPIIKKCYLNGRFIEIGETYKINCNDCKCQWMGDRMDLICDQQECIINSTLINIVNNNWNRYGWRARNYSEFWGRRLSEGISLRLGTLLSARKVLAMAPISPDYDARELPFSFDTRHKWRGLIELPRDQGWCGASWAISTVSVISDRMNIHLNSHYKPLSPQHLLSCNVRNQPDSGCNGGHLTRAWIFIRKFGLVTEECYPWEGYRTRCVIPKRKHAKESRCVSPQMQRSPLHRVAPVYRIAGEQDIMYEIQKSGPVQATMRVYQDFFTYGSGIYKCTSIAKEHRTGYHSVRIIGWGEEMQYGQRVKYWIAANSWGESWGENGFFRIRRGSNDCKIEDFVLAAWAAQEKTASINFKDPTSIDNRISNAI